MATRHGSRIGTCSFAGTSGIQRAFCSRHGQCRRSPERATWNSSSVSRVCGTRDNRLRLHEVGAPSLLLGRREVVGEFLDQSQRTRPRIHLGRPARRRLSRGVHRNEGLDHWWRWIIGSTIASALLDSDHVPVILDNLITGRREFVEGRIFYEGSVSDKDSSPESSRAS